MKGPHKKHVNLKITRLLSRHIICSCGKVFRWFNQATTIAALSQNIKSSWFLLFRSNIKSSQFQNSDFEAQALDLGQVKYSRAANYCFTNVNFPKDSATRFGWLIDCVQNFTCYCIYYTQRRARLTALKTASTATAVPPITRAWFVERGHPTSPTRLLVGTSPREWTNGKTSWTAELIKRHLHLRWKNDKYNRAHDYCSARVRKNPSDKVPLCSADNSSCKSFHY